MASKYHKQNLLFNRHRLPKRLSPDKLSTLKNELKDPLKNAEYIFPAIKDTILR